MRYPSLLESSDIDGGSSVAVLTYLRRILESLDHPDMINLILHYLLALPDSAPPNRKPSRSSITAARARKSMDLATLMADKTDDAVTPLLFNLVDLILSCLRSRNQQTIHVTLQLVSAILKRHHRYAVTTLLRTEVLPTRPVHRTVGAHEQEVAYIMSLAGSIGGKANFDEMYENTLRDTMTRLESHPCSLRLVAPRVSTNNHELPELPDSLPGAPRDVREHTLRPDDPLLNVILDLTETFFLNPVETNLSVTETMLDLAICGYMNIEGWLARSPATYSYEDENRGHPDDEKAAETEANEPFTPSAALESSVLLFDDEEDRVKSMDACRARPNWRQESVPRVLDVVRRLCDQISNYRETIPRFEDLLDQRREAFQTAEAMLDQPPPPVRKASPPVRKQSPLSFATPERRSMDETLRTGSPSRPSALEGFAQRLLSELGTPSRSASPKGRREASRTSGTSTPGGSQAGTSAHLETPKALRVPPGAFPIGTGTGTDPVKGGIARSLSPGSIIAPSPEEEDSVVASQASEFAAIDQSILSRKVGLPDEKIRPIPLDLRRAAQRKAARNVDEEHASESDADVTDSSVYNEEASEETVSVSHILTNIIILQSFLMELASLMQVRAGLFDEVRYV